MPHGKRLSLIWAALGFVTVFDVDHVREKVVFRITSCRSLVALCCQDQTLADGRCQGAVCCINASFNHRIEHARGRMCADFLKLFQCVVPYILKAANDMLPGVTVRNIQSGNATTCDAHIWHIFLLCCPVFFLISACSLAVRHGNSCNSRDLGYFKPSGFI